MDVSSDTILNSCSLGLKRRITNTLKDEDCCGPRVLYEVFFKRYNPSHTRVAALVKKLDEADLRSHPGENVTLFVKFAIEQRR